MRDTCVDKHRRPGHLFQGRFKAKLVEDEAYLLAVTRYIHLNPVKFAACRRMGQERGQTGTFHFRMLPGMSRDGNL